MKNAWNWFDRALMLTGVVALWVIASQLAAANGHLYEIRLNALDLKNAAWAAVQRM